MSTSKPTFIIVHGSWHVPASYQDLTTALGSAGFPTRCPALPSCSRHAPQRSEDVNVIRAEIEKKLSAGKSVVILAHSYGGMVASEAIQEAHSVETRKAQGLKGGVSRIIYLTSMLAPPGQSSNDLMIHNVNGKIDMEVDEDGVLFRVRNPQEAFYNDVQPQTKVDAVVALLVDQATSAAIAPVPSEISPGWMHVPCAYIYGELDNAICFELQQKIVELIKEKGARLDKEVVLHSSHSSWLSQLDKCMAAIQACL